MSENQIIRQVADTALDQSHIMQYLRVVANNIHMSVLNQAMIFLQKPDAKMVCGREAWKKMHRQVKPNAVPIVLFFPCIKMKRNNDPDEEAVSPVIYREDVTYVNNYLPVNAFDVENTSGEELSDHRFNYETVTDNIMQITGATIEYAALPPGIKSKYDKTGHVLYLSDTLSDRNSDEKKLETKLALVSAYLDYIYETYHVTDKLLKQAILQVIYNYYGNTAYTIPEQTFKKLGQRQTADKLKFLASLQFFTSNIVQDFDGYYLDFDETALLNSLLYTGNTQDIFILLDKVMCDVEDELLKNKILGLRIKLMHTDSEHLMELYRHRKSQDIYTYPPYQIHVDITDYLQEDRAQIMSEML